jgi:hypothetical protein
VSLGVGAVTLGGAFTFEMLRRSAEDEAKTEPTQLGFQSALDTMESRKTIARALLGVGGAAIVAGGVLLLVDRSGQPTTQVGFNCVAGGCAVSAGRRF